MNNNKFKETIISILIASILAILVVSDFATGRIFGVIELLLAVVILRAIILDRLDRQG